MSICTICREDSPDYVTSCGHDFHMECLSPWLRRNKCCPYFRAKIKIIVSQVLKPLSKSCDVCKSEGSDFVTRCHYFMHKDKCLGFGNKRYGKCSVCNIFISRSQTKETLEDLETLSPLSLRELAFLACENSRFFKNVSLEFVIKRLSEKTSFLIDDIVFIRTQRTLIDIACSRDNVEAIRELARLGADLNNSDRYHSPIYHAINTNNVELFKYLIELGADPLRLENIHILALSSLNNDDSRIFEGLIELGFDPLARFDNIRDNDKNKYLLMIAVRSNQFNTVVKLVDQYNIDVNAKSALGNSAILNSSRFCDPRMINFLLERGADINVKDDYGYGVFELACKKYNLVAVKKFYELLNPDINAHFPFDWTPLCYAIESGNMEFFEFVISHGADPNLPTKSKVLPISYACAFGKFEIVQRLLELGCSLNKLFPGVELLPIHRVASSPFSSYIRLKLNKLMEFGADVNARDIHGNTALHYIVSQRNMSVVIEELVVLYGADVNIKNYRGERPIDLKIKEETISLLLSLGSFPKKRWYYLFSCCGASE